METTKNTFIKPEIHTYLESLPICWLSLFSLFYFLITKGSSKNNVEKSCKNKSIGKFYVQHEGIIGGNIDAIKYYAN